MRSIVISTIMLSLVAGGVLNAGAAPHAAQPATPAIESVGVSGGAVGSGEPEEAPGQLLSLRRGVFAPGGNVPLHHHPGALVIFVESGTLTYSVHEGEAVLTRAVAEGTPAPTERIGPGTATQLRPGDVVYEEGVVHVTENLGDEPAVIWIAALTATDEPLTQFRATSAP